MVYSRDKCRHNGSMNISDPKSYSNLRTRPLIFLDLETTGLKVQEHEILEIGAMKVESKKPFKILDQFEIRVKPKHLEKADQRSLEVVEYSDIAWSDAKPLDQALRMLDEFADNGVLVGFNVHFDWAVLDKAYHFMGREDPFYYQRVDAMSMAYSKLFAKHSIKRFSLAETCRYLDIKQQEAHHALADAKTTYLVFKALMKQ